MAKSADIVRRSLGGVFIAAAIVMLILGQTVLADSLQGEKTLFIFYWLGCFAFTALAALVALLDFIVMRRRIRRHQLEFLENTLREIAEKKAKSEQDNLTQ